jgi:AcrR family transcriptional regulator
LAASAEATGERIIEAALARFQEQWFEEVTLDAVAKDAGVTIQTVLRRFGSKELLLQAAAEHLNEKVLGRRAVEDGDVARAVDVLTADYEAAGDLVWRLLAQEERYPVLQAICERGRWKLVRRDMRRSIAAYKSIVRGLLDALLHEGAVPAASPGRTKRIAKKVQP